MSSLKFKYRYSKRSTDQLKEDIQRMKITCKYIFFFVTNFGTAVPQLVCSSFQIGMVLAVDRSVAEEYFAAEEEAAVIVPLAAGAFGLAVSIAGSYQTD